MTAVPVTGQELRSWCGEEGFPRSGVVPSSRLPAFLRSHPEIAALGAGTYLLAALPCFRREPDDLSSPGDPHGLIAPFARRNYYREAVLRLRRVAARVAAAAGSDRRELRIFCNSRLPEKPLAEVCGLGAYGRNALVLIPGLGSLFVIAGMFLPAEIASGMDEQASGERPGAEPGAPRSLQASRPNVGALCGECRACQDACPVAALREAGRLDESRCLQAWAGRHGDLPESLAGAWGFRLYGCQVCQDVCPYNRGLELETPTDLGELGPSVSLRRVLERSPEELAQTLKETALGMSWIGKPALQRNAVLAAGHRARAGDPLREPLGRLLNAYRRHPDPVLARAAAWALGSEAAEGERS